MTVKEALEVGLARIREHGWIQGSAGDTLSGYCAIGALPTDSLGFRFHPGAINALAAQAHSPYLAKWNDEPGRTQAEVETTYEAAIEAEKA